MSQEHKPVKCIPSATVRLSNPVTYSYINCGTQWIKREGYPNCLRAEKEFNGMGCWPSNCILKKSSESKKSSIQIPAWKNELRELLDEEDSYYSDGQVKPDKLEVFFSKIEKEAEDRGFKWGVSEGRHAGSHEAAYVTRIEERHKVLEELEDAIEAIKTWEKPHSRSYDRSPIVKFGDEIKTEILSLLDSLKQTNN